MELDKKKVTDIFLNQVCGKKYIRVGREDLQLPIDFRIWEGNSIKQQSVKEEKENDEKAIVDITDFELFEDKLCEYVKKFIDSKLFWTNAWISDTEEDDIKLAIISLFTNATWQDFENPIDLIDRFKCFLEEDKLRKDLKDGKTIFVKDDTTLKVKVQQNDWELETPFRYVLEASDNQGKKQYPGVHYGIHNNEAYIYAVQGIKYLENYKQNNYENETISQMRSVIRQDGIRDDYRRAEPLAVVSLICFLETLKQYGIEKVNVANYLPLRYDSKTLVYGNEVSDKVQEVATDRLLLQIRRVMHYHSNGIKLLNVPGETGDFLSIDIKDYKPKGEISEEICKNIDRSLQTLDNIEER